ncbi:TfuA-like protein [Mesorhizobium sp. M0058]|uniref:TfuA-like protein n=1 Tax=Mesorhizobium sp. M0058 TaxID=2956865 RepID=UPI003338626F
MRVIFAGPSTYGVDKSLLDGLVIRAPARCGDIFQAAENGASTIGLIDGTFESGMSVWHKEILYALDQGIKIAGAASMGALRAVECERYGMVGIGEIFKQFQSGLRTRDADVALLFAPAEMDYMPLTITQVDFEETLAALALNGAIPSDAAARLRFASLQLHYKNRTIASIFLQAGMEAKSDIEKEVRNNWINRKRLDSLQLLSWAHAES